MVIDVETAGFEPRVHALLEIAIVITRMDEAGRMQPGSIQTHAIQPFQGSRLDAASLKFNGIDPDHPARQAVDERSALLSIFAAVREELRRTGCTRAVLVGHNPAFDLAFLNAAAERSGIRRNPFHPFSTFDTGTLGALVYGQTVLAKAARAAGLDWDHRSAHSACYDAERTAQLFCTVVNRWQDLSGSRWIQSAASEPVSAASATAPLSSV